VARALTQWPESASGHRDRPSWPGFRLWLAGRRPDLVCWSDGTDAINASETDCLAEFETLHLKFGIRHDSQLGAGDGDPATAIARREEWQQTVHGLAAGACRTKSTACAPGATVAAISTRCRFIASVLQVGRIRAAPLPCFGQTAPKM
jgi:hypothetical protein